MPNTIESVLRRAFATAERRGDCLLVTEWAPGTGGYVHAKIAGRGYRIHRLVAEREIGRPLGTDEVDHTCHSQSDCPPGECYHRRCIEPTHLEVVDRDEHMRRDKLSVALRQTQKTHCPKNHPYTGENLHVTPQGWRVCVTCARAKVRRQRGVGHG